MSGTEIMNGSYLLRYAVFITITAGNLLFLFINSMPMLPQNRIKTGVFIVVKLFTASYLPVCLPYMVKMKFAQDLLLLLVDYGGLLLLIYLFSQYIEASLFKICTTLMLSDLWIMFFVYMPMQLMPVLLGHHSLSVFTMPWSWKASLLLIGELAFLCLVQKCMYPLYHKYRDRNMEVKQEVFWFGIYVIYVLAQVLVSLIGESAGTLSEKLQKSMVLAALIGGAIILYLYVNRRNQRFEREYEALKGQKSLLEKQLYEMQHQEEQLYYFQQEVEEHLKRVQSSVVADKEGEARRYFLRLQERYQQMSYKDYCGDMTLNGLLNEKEKQAKKCGVSLYIDLSKQYAAPTDAVELIDLISQVLDFGVEECRRADTNEKKITFRCGQIRQRQIIDCIYPTLGDQKKQGGGKKERAVRRAYRQKEESLRQLVRHNGGTLQVIHAHGEKEVIIMMA